MEWIKVLNKHVLFEYNDLSDSEFRAWIKIMSLTAQIEHEPTKEQMLFHTHYKTLTSLQDKLNKRSITLQEVLNKVLIDVQEVLNKKNYWKQQKKQQRALSENVHKDVHRDVLKMSNNRLDKIREDKNIYTPIIPEWIKKETWDAFIEMRKSLKAKPTTKAVELIISKLRIYKNNGQDPNSILEQSIENNWKGVFALREDRYAGAGPGTYRGSGQVAGKEGGNGSGSRQQPPEYKPEPKPDVSPEEQQRNLARLRGIINGISSTKGRTKAERGIEPKDYIYAGHGKRIDALGEESGSIGTHKNGDS